MSKTFDISIDALSTSDGIRAVHNIPPSAITLPSPTFSAENSAAFGAATSSKAFYIETFGCQMNAHDSEKVSGVLIGRGYRQVEDLDSAKVVFYNTCSIREKAAQ